MNAVIWTSGATQRYLHMSPSALNAQSVCWTPSRRIVEE